MAKGDNRTKIEFEYEGKDYTLVYSADALKKMEKNYGVKFAKLDETVLSSVEDLFVGAFIENHNNVPLSKRLAIYEQLCAQADEENITLSDILMEMLTEAIADMKPKGNVPWKVSRRA